MRRHLETARDQIYSASGIADCVGAAVGRAVPRPSRFSVQYALEGAHALLQKAGGALIDVLDDEPIELGPKSRANEDDADPEDKE